jgi:hypothetical protein
MVLLLSANQWIDVLIFGCAALMLDSSAGQLAFVKKI